MISLIFFCQLEIGLQNNFSQTLTSNGTPETLVNNLESILLYFLSEPVLLKNS